MLLKLRRINFILLLLPFLLSAQSTDEQLAQQAFSNREYEKAVVYYEKLYDKNSDKFYQNYFTCLLHIKEFRKAEKIAKKMLKSSPGMIATYLDLAAVYLADGSDSKKAEEQYTKAIKEIRDISQVYVLAQRFLDIKQFDYAIQTYQKGGKLEGGAYPFSYEMADVYQLKGDLKSMIKIYLDVLEDRGESELYMVQTRLSASLGYDDEDSGISHPLLKTELLRRIQSNPDKTVLAEMLVWIQMQQKDYEGAFIQCKALDKRKREGGLRLFELGTASAAEGQYEIAQKCFDYVLEKGSTEFYQQAMVESASVLYEKVTLSGAYSKQDLTDLENKLMFTLSKIRGSGYSFTVVKKLAHLQACYMSKDTAAVRLLRESIDGGAFTNSAQAELKLELGDVLLLQGEIWEASLLYSQVDKAFKHEPIGQEAKFRNAKVSYYAGDFKWSKAQLDILKGATSKLIANDAMDLSLVISDAIGVDTNAVPLQWFASAELLIRQNKLREAIAKMDSINLIWPDHSLVDDILMQKAAIAYRNGNYKEAADLYQKVVNEFGTDIFADDALFRLAGLYELKLKDAEKAKALYETMMVDYSGSVFTTEARKRYRKLRGDKVN